MHPARKRILRFSALALLVVFIALQLVRPVPNAGVAEGPDSIVAHHDVPEDVRAILRRSCYDCHSDYTTYPWYARVQPVRWWLDSHIREGREHLNFSVFGRYDTRSAVQTLDEIVNTLIAGSMPLKSYTWIHREAALTKAEVDMVADWAEDLIDELSEN
jgi:hypothetical protein